MLFAYSLARLVEILVAISLSPMTTMLFLPGLIEGTKSEDGSTLYASVQHYLSAVTAQVLQFRLVSASIAQFSVMIKPHPQVCL